MRTNSADISVIITTYNDAIHLEECLSSVLAQTLKPKEILVIDDGSDDLESIDILDKLKARYPSVTFIHQQNQGPSAARNVGILKAKGNKIAFLDTDDRYTENNLEHRVAYFEGNERIIAAYGGYVAVSEHGKKKFSKFCAQLESKLHNDGIGIRYPGGTPLWMFKTKPLKEIGGFDENLRIMEDFDLILRLNRQTGLFVGDNAPVYIRNIELSSLTRASDWTTARGSMAFLKKARVHQYFSILNLLYRYLGVCWRIVK